MQKSVDEPEDKKEEYDEDDEDEEKATVDVTRPLPEPGEEDSEPAGQRPKTVTVQQQFKCGVTVTVTLCDLSVSLYEFCQEQRVCRQDRREKGKRSVKLCTVGNITHSSLNTFRGRYIQVYFDENKLQIQNTETFQRWERVVQNKMR